MCSSQTYISLAPSLTNTAGTISDKSNIALEIGQQWDVFSQPLTTRVIHNRQEFGDKNE